MVESRKFWIFLKALFYFCTIDRTSLMKQNVAKKRPIFRGANAPFYNVPHKYGMIWRIGSSVFDFLQLAH